MICSRLSTRAAVSRASATSTSILGAASTWMPRRFASTEDKKADTKKEAAPEGEGEAAIPEAVHEELTKLRADLKEMTKKADEYKKAAHYSAAEAENARRIAREDVQKANNFGITKFAKDVLEVNDTLERAIEAFEKLEPEEKKTLTEHKILNGLVTGVKMSHSVMVHNMHRHGVESIKANPGDEFDCNFHDAVFQAPATDEITEGQIATVVKKGYMLKDRVLRATQVGVAHNLTGAS